MVEWGKINLPWFEVDEFANVLVDKVRILDLLDKWGVEYAQCSSGEFSHRLKCPLPSHLDGGERTPSFFVSENQNKFYCFGCNSGGNIIDLVSLYTGRPYHESMRWLATLIGITSSDVDESLKNLPKREKRDPEKMVSSHAFRAGIAIRDHLDKIKDKKEYKKWCAWADDRFDKLDEFLELANEEWENVKKYCDEMINHLKSGLP